MLNDVLTGRWIHLKNNMQHLLGRLSDIQEKLVSKKRDKGSPEKIHIDNYHYESHRVDDLQLTLNKDPGPGIKYNYTENSEFARGADKAEAVGIDSFGEEDTFDPDEADEHQDYRNRKHSSDLSDRFYTRGLDTHPDDLHQ
jgi:hypothetical protein